MKYVSHRCRLLCESCWSCRPAAHSHLQQSVWDSRISG
jgi:hypothetical protein